jgi:predicted transcriptional regulator
MPPARQLLEHLFGSRSRAKLLRLLLTNPEKSYFVREISRKIGEHINSVRRELQFLTDAGFVVASGEGQKRFYQANGTSTIFPELKALVFKAQVMEEQQLLSAVQASGRIYLMVLSGFFIGQPDAPTDLLIVGSVNRQNLQRLLKTFRHHFDREIRYTVLSQAEYQYRHSLTDRFLYEILSGPLITVVDKRKTARA